MRNEPTPILLTRDEHVDEIMTFRRQKRIDRISDDIIFEEDERLVAREMAEPDDPIESRRIDWTILRDITGALALNFAGIAFGWLLIWECLRP